MRSDRFEEIPAYGGLPTMTMTGASRFTSLARSASSASHAPNNASCPCTGRGYLDTKLFLRGDPLSLSSVPRFSGRCGAEVAVLLGQPLAVVELDEGLDGGAQLGHCAVDAAVDDLLFEGPEEALRDAVGLGLLDEGVARFHTPEAHLVAEVLGDVLGAVVHAQGEPASGVRREAAELCEQPLRDGLQSGEAIAALADVAADDLAAIVVDGREDPAHALFGGEHARAVGAPHEARGVGGDAALVARGLTAAHAARGEQAVLAHEAQHAPPRDAQARPDLAVALAGKRRAGEVVLDQRVKLLVADRGRRAPAGRRALGWRSVEGRARQAPGSADAPHAVGPAGGHGDRGAQRFDLRPPKGPGRSIRACSSSFSMESSPMRRMAASSWLWRGSPSRSLSPASRPASALSFHFSRR